MLASRFCGVASHQGKYGCGWAASSHPSLQVCGLDRAHGRLHGARHVALCRHSKTMAANDLAPGRGRFVCGSPHWFVQRLVVVCWRCTCGGLASGWQQHALSGGPCFSGAAAGSVCCRNAFVGRFPAQLPYN